MGINSREDLADTNNKNRNSQEVQKKGSPALSF